MDENKLFENYYGVDLLHSVPNKLIYVIGCGGTGSAFVRDAARLCSVYKKKNQGVECSMVLCDADIVEDKNIERQNFIPRDVSKNKAQVLAERYSAAFGINIGFIDRYIENVDDMQSFVNTSKKDFSSRPAIYIYSFVDNVRTRIMMHNFFISNCGRSKGNPSVVWTDTGNSEFAGQLVTVSTNMIKVNGSTGDREGRLDSRAADVVEVCPDLLDRTKWDKFASELSCEDAAESAPQSMAANTTAANLSLNVLYSQLFGTQDILDYYQITFNTVKNSFRSLKPYRSDYDKIKRVGVVDLGGDK